MPCVKLSLTIGKILIKILDQSSQHSMQALNQPFKKKFFFCRIFERSRVQSANEQKPVKYCWLKVGFLIEDSPDGTLKEENSADTPNYNVEYLTATK